MSEYEMRVLVCEYLNGITNEANLLSRCELVKCVTCGNAILEEDAHNHENDDDKYCDGCWEAGF